MAIPRTPEEWAAWHALSEQVRSVTRDFFALDEGEREVLRTLLVAGPQERYPRRVARFINELDALDEVQWRAFWDYVEIVFARVVSAGEG